MRVLCACCCVYIPHTYRVQCFNRRDPPTALCSPVEPEEEEEERVSRCACAVRAQRTALHHNSTQWCITIVCQKRNMNLAPIGVCACVHALQCGAHRGDSRTGRGRPGVTTVTGPTLRLRALGGARTPVALIHYYYTGTCTCSMRAARLHCLGRLPIWLSIYTACTAAYSRC